MRKLVLEENSSTKDVPVRTGITIGKAEGNTIRVEGQNVEDRHAKVVPLGERTFVEDLDTPFGVLVNGKKVARWALSAGDVIEIGNRRMTYQEDDQPEPPPPKKKAKARPSETSVQPAVKAGSQQAAAKPGASAKVSGARAAAGPPTGRTPAGTSGRAVATSGARSAVAGPSAAQSGQRAGVPAKGPAGVSGSGAEVASTSGARSAVGKDASAGRLKIVLPDPNKEGGAGRGPSVRIKLGAEAASLSGANRTVSGRTPAVSPSESKAAEPKTSQRISLPIGKQDSEKLAAAAPVPAPSEGRTSAVSGRVPAQGAMSRAKLRAERTDELSLLPKLSRKGKAAAIAIAALLVLGLAGVLAWPYYARWREAALQADESTRAEREARARLLESGPKSPDDLRFVQEDIKRAKGWDGVKDLLGEPHLDLEEKILTYDPDAGTQEVKGHRFRGYYLKDAQYPHPEEGVVAPALIFHIDQDGTFSIVRSRFLARDPNVPPVEPAEEKPEAPEGEIPPEPELEPTPK